MAFPTDFYNRFSRDNNYRRILYRPEKGLQSAEMNENHDYLHDNLTQFTDILIGDGVVMQGGKIHLNESCTVATLEEAAFIAEGYIIVVPARTSIVVDAINDFEIGVLIQQTVIDEITDPTLRDPAVNTVMFGEPGGCRLRLVGEWKLTSELVAPPAGEVADPYYPIHKIQAGALTLVQPNATDVIMEPVRELVARYDRSSNGSYIVDGIDVQYLNEDVVNQKHVLSLGAGYAHVYGYEIVFTNDRHQKIDWATDEQFVNNEPITFTADGDYDLRNYPISRLTEVFGIKQTSGWNAGNYDSYSEIDHGNFPGCSDELPKQPVVDIVKVEGYIAGVMTEYEKTISWVQTGNNVDWSPAGPGAEPDPGSTYYVQYQYTEEITNEVIISTDRRSIAVTGFHPSTIFYVDYHYYLSRWDRLSLLRTGEVKVTKGIPNDPDKVAKPLSAEGLALCSVLSAYGSEPTIESDALRVFKMEDIQDLQDKIYELQYNFARLSQMQDSNLKDPSSIKKNMFVDPLYDDDLRDMGLLQDGVIVDGILTPGVDWTTYSIRSGNTITLPFTETLKINQDSYTKTRKVNSMDYADIKTVIDVSPASMRWISSTVGSRTPPSQVTDTGATIPTGTILTLTGGKYASSESIKIYIDDIEVVVVSANNEGELNTTFEVPAGIKAGTKMISAEGQTSGAVGQVNFIANAIQQKLALITREHGAFEVAGRSPQSVFKRRYGDLPSYLQDKAKRYGKTHWGVEGIYRHYQKCMTTGNHSLEWCVRYDPLAQTFTLDEKGFVTSIEVYITTKPVDPNEIVEVAIHSTNVGIPDRESILMTVSMFSSELVEGWNKFIFREPTFLEEGIEYAIIVFTRDVETYIRVAEIGAYDLQNNIWLSSQSSQGVLLESANRSTWTAIPKEDMTFKLNMATFDTTNTTKIGEVDVLYQMLTNDVSSGTLVVCNIANTTGFTVGQSIRIKDTSSNEWATISDVVTDVSITLDELSNSYQTSRNSEVGSPITDINLTTRADVLADTTSYFYATLVRDSNREVALSSGGSVAVDLYTGHIDFYCTLTTTDTTVSPSLEGDISISLGKVIFPSTYISRSFPVSAGTLKCNLDLYEPTSSTVEVHALTGSDPTVEGDWTELSRQPGTTPVGDGFIDTPFSVTIAEGTTKIRVRLNSTVTTNRPFVENLRAYVT